MKLISLLFAGTLLLPSAVSAETWYLVIAARHGYYSGELQSLPMTTEEECNEAGNKIYNSKDNRNDINDIHGIFHHVRYVCLKGK